MAYFTALGVGFFLGIKHALEPDHVIAVSTIVSSNRKVSNAIKVGLFWGLGHTLTLLILGLLLIAFKVQVPDQLGSFLEMLVGVMLVYLGAKSLIRLKKSRLHVHEHHHHNSQHHHVHSHQHTSDHDHQHLSDQMSFKSALIGMVHGVSGSGALVLLVLMTVDTTVEAVGFISIFGLGTAIGMLMSTLMIVSLLKATERHAKTSGRLTTATGWISVCFGLFYIYTCAMQMVG